ncbi:type I secretion system permease/ATPase (plasmid) [Picosynechococcus sp. PCC 11901]|nr:peptidase domain-containing ABC transporter [Picosynechococcus sp. PCC 11901]QCS48016.1 type I secretion system permease/ATPase [Picosynechococcus sp. PCC 11901]
MEVRDYEEFFATTPPFNQLSEAIRAKLSHQVTPFRYRMGQSILEQGKQSNQISVVYQGQVRVLGKDPQTKQPISLALRGKGGVMGAVNAVRGMACETAIASTETICLSLTNTEFLTLLEESAPLKKTFKESCSLTEAFELLSQDFAHQAKIRRNVKDMAQQASETAIVYELAPGIYGEDNPAIRPLKESERIWFVSSGGLLEGYPPRGRLPLISAATVVIKGNQAARLVGFPTAIWASSAAVTAIPEASGAEPKTWPDPFEQTPGEKAEVSEIEAEEIPYAPVEVLDLPPEADTETRHYPFIKGTKEEEVAIACLQMLAKHYKMRFRGDSIRRILKEQLSRYGQLSLPSCGAIVELMGLNAHLVKIPPQAITRLTTPLLVKWRDELAVIYQVSDKEITIGAPALGLVKRSPQDFISGWGDEQTGVDVLLLQKSKYAPEERFGLSWFIPSLKKYRWILIEVLVASFLVQLFALANPLIIQQIIDKVIVQQSSDTLQIYGALLLILAIFEAVLSSLRTYLFVDTTNRIDMNLGSEIIDHLFRLPLQYFEKRPVGEISTRVGELEKIRQFLTGTALTVVLDAIFSVVYILVMFYYHGKLAAVALSVIPIFIVATLIFSPIIRYQLRDRAEKNAESQSYLVEVMTGVQTVKAQNIELRSRWKWQEKYARYVSAGFNTVITSTASSSISNFLNKLSGLLVLWYGTSLVLQGPEVLTLGQLIAFRIIAGYVTSPILRLTQLWQNFQDTSISLERLADIVDHPQEGEADRENMPMPQIKGAVTYENISFRFKKHGPLNLNNVNLHFPAGTFVAIVGQSGAGKSTLTKLLSRLYEPESGRILIDGYDVNKVELYSLRRQVGVVPQETLLFEGTIQENIALTNPEAEPEEIEAAARVASAHDFIMESLPNGYNTQVGERGATLSGGQKQRIAIARSVLQRPRILVLDEATSALDYLTEREVCNNLKEAFNDTTVFFITHRLDTIKDADVIVLMHEGYVAEQGTHSELMAMRGRYYSLYQQQARSGT